MKDLHKMEFDNLLLISHSPVLVRKKNSGNEERRNNFPKYKIIYVNGKERRVKNNLRSLIKENTFNVICRYFQKQGGNRAYSVVFGN